jgi:hypothetical protein
MSIWHTIEHLITHFIGLSSQPELNSQESSKCDHRLEVHYDKLVVLAAEAAINTNKIAQLKIDCSLQVEEHNVSEAYIQDALITGWEKALEQILEEGLLAKNTEESLMQYARDLKLSQHELDRNGSYTRAGQATVLRDITEGVTPQRIRVNGSLPFNMQKGETLVWLFHNVTFYEEKTFRTYVGKSSGFSVRIAKGLYYRTGSFKGWPIETNHMVTRGNGALGVTTKHIYFAGDQKSLRIPYKKIIQFIPYSDGLAIHTDGKSDKAIAFKIGEGWFVYNLVQNLSQADL